MEKQNIIHILPHAWWKYFHLSLGYLCVILPLGLIFSWIQSPQLQRLFGIIGCIACAKYLYDFVDIYIDSTILTDKGITIVNIGKRFTYKTDFFERSSIVSISHTQTGFVDKLTNQGSITISLDHDSDYCIDHVYNPTKQASIINKLKFEALEKKKISESLAQENIVQQPDKFELLVDTLSDVIGAYMRQGKEHE